MLGDILSFIGKGIDAWSSSSNADKQNEANAKIAAANIAHQKEFAQHGVRWKVADAQAAGLHPLAALGAQTNSFSNVVGGDFATGKTDFGGMGQDIGRAIDAGSTQVERQDRMSAALQKTAQAFQLEKMNLENELLKTNIARNVATTPPPFPATGVPLPRPGPDRTFGGHATSDEKIQQKPENLPPVKTNRFFGLPLDNPPWQSSGQDWEDQHGEYMGGLLGATNLPASIAYTLWTRGRPDTSDWLRTMYETSSRRPASETRWRRKP